MIITIASVSWKIGIFGDPSLLLYILSDDSSNRDRMAAPGDIYERELKGLLSGDPKVIEKMIKTCDEKETKWYKSLIDNPFMVIRAAGSLGVDLVALRWDYSFPIEVKSSSEDTMHFSKNPRLMEQATRMMNDCSNAQLLPIYAFRLKNQKGDPWRLFSLPMECQLKGAMGLLQRHIPPVEMNSNGNYIIRWKDGIKLSDLVDYMQFQV